MKGSCKSVDVFEFREEDELTEMAANRFTAKFRNSHALDLDYSFLGHVTCGAEVQSKETDTEICGVVNAADIDHNCDASGSFNPLETEEFADKKTPTLNNDLHNNFKSHEQPAVIKSNILEPGSGFPSAGCSLSPGSTVCLADQSNFAFPESSFNDELVGLASDVDESKTSSDGHSTDNCFSRWDLGDDKMGVVFYPDYIDYRGTHYLDSVVSFSSSFVEVKSKTIYGIKGTFHIQLEIDDIVKIESQWSARCETGTINIYFISKDVTRDETVNNTSVSGIQELKFPAVDSNWYEKREAIESLDLRYKALWRVLLDIGMERCSALPDWKSMTPPRSYFPNFDKPVEEVIYPKGDPDAVSISKRDIDLLQPDTFVNDTIIDFYIKYLKNRQNIEERIKFHFFNSFFFRKLADMDKDPSSAFDGKAAFLRVRKWTRKVNLLEKDFIFIPVNYNYHWSLIVICYFGEVASNTDVTNDKLVRVPCILHMDSVRGSHMGLKDLMQSYLWEEWKERKKETCEDLHSKFRNLKFVSLELPQQQNSYDCGLFLLHYVERFLEEVPVNFSIYSITSSSKFLQADWFPPGEASMKRAHIERLIYDLLETSSEDCSPSSGSDPDCSPNDPKTTNAYKNGVEFSEISRPLRGCHGSSLYSQSGQGIEMTLLPSSSITTAQCASSGLILKELFEPGSASGSFSDVHSQAFEHGASLDELRKPVSLTEEEVANEHFVQTEFAEPAFEHLDGLIPRAPIFAHPSGDFRLEPDDQAVLEDADSSLATSGGESDDVSEVEADEKYESFEANCLDNELDKPRCVLSKNKECSTVSFSKASGVLVNTAASRSLVGISDQNENSFLLKNLPDFCQETNQLQDSHTSHEFLPSCHPFVSGDTLDGADCESQYLIGNSNDVAYPPTLASVVSPVSSNEGNNMQVMGVDGVSLSESDEQHAAKRIRITGPLVSSNEGNNMQVMGVDGVSLSESDEQRAAKRIRITGPDEDEKFTSDLSNDLHL